ncbi:MAG: hypothetical protein JXA91_04080 [Candidatus Thermoplasmatota archaeon]|nr:hypothetical protein [Candidatus Thermoplasmatota archaeon]
MITKQLIKKVENFAYSQSDKYHAPSRAHINIANEKGQWLAKKLKAKKDIVYLGTLLMDCKLGHAYSQNKLPQHIKMSAAKAEEILSKDPKITREEKENVLHCIKEHHGVKKFFSIESEIVSNADCYQFASVRGMIGGITNTMGMSLDDLIALYEAKADEKWNSLTLDICKKELEPQYKAIKKLFSNYNY